jgi:hypothetical protein
MFGYKLIFTAVVAISAVSAAVLPRQAVSTVQGVVNTGGL